MHFDKVAYLWTFYGPTPSWRTILYIPAGVNILTPPVVFHYHYRMMRSTTDIQRAFSDRLLQLESAAIYTSQCWHECVGGQRGWVLPADTVQWLQHSVRDVHLDPNLIDVRH